VIDAVSAIGAASAALGSGFWHLIDADVVEVLRHVHRAEAQIAGLKLLAVREAQTRSVPAQVGARSLKGYLQQALRMSPRLAEEQAALAEALAVRYGRTAVALAAGDCSYEQARAVVDTVE